MNMKFSIDTEKLKGIGKIGLKIGKQIVIDGTKALAMKAAKVAIETAFHGESLKTMTLDDVLAGSRSERIVFGTNGEVVNTVTGDVYVKLDKYEKDIVDGELKRDIEPV